MTGACSIKAFKAQSNTKQFFCYDSKTNNRLFPQINRLFWYLTVSTFQKQFSIFLKTPKYKQSVVSTKQSVHNRTFWVPWERTYPSLVLRTWFDPWAWPSHGSYLSRGSPRGGVGTSRVRLLPTGTKLWPWSHLSLTALRY